MRADKPSSRLEKVVFSQAKRVLAISAVYSIYFLAAGHKGAEFLGKEYR